MSHHLTGINAYRESGAMPDMEELVADRRRELEDASAVLGVTDVRFLGYDDSITTIQPEIVSDIADVIGEIAPHVVITHWPHDTVGAHALATQMLLIATDTAAGIREGKSYAPTGGDTEAGLRRSSTMTREGALTCSKASTPGCQTPSST